MTRRPEPLIPPNLELEETILEAAIERLENRVLILEALVEMLAGKALADSGATRLRLQAMAAENAVLPEKYAGDPVNEANLQDLQDLFRQRVKLAYAESLNFPRRWKRARRPRREPSDED